MTRIAELQDRLHRLAKRREDEGIYTDANLVEAASARIAELEAENARLTGKLSLAQGVAGAVQARAALSRTGAVKVKRSDILTKIALWADDEGMELSMGQGDDLAGRILSALEPAAPEGRQEAVDDEDLLRKALVLITEYGHHDATLAEAICQFIRRSTLPSEQAVTEAMVEAALNSWFDGEIPVSFSGDFRADMRAALKAAMEAGRHD